MIRSDDLSLDETILSSLKWKNLFKKVFPVFVNLKKGKSANVNIIFKLFSYSFI